MKHSKNEKGFTLIELMVVVIIIGILAAVAVPRFTNAADKARKEARNAQKKLIETAVQIYYAAEGKWPTSDGKADENGTQIDFEKLADYLDSVEPKDPQDGSQITASVTNKGDIKINWDPDSAGE
ncbi:MAG TPA: prepilin-type N-terminal cleavage/methylation domain-containing protein [Clostridia bacterium]|nr:prepilin-type N-terminal cleavage/methylation domain-containing protein [Clostridia bacterium]